MNTLEFTKAFKKMLEKDNITRQVNSLQDIEDFLSEKFSKLYSEMSDAQDAYDTLYTSYKFVLDEFNEGTLVYTLGSTEWSVQFKTPEDIALIDCAIKEWDCTCVTNIDQLCSALEHQVMKDMSNAGCDCYNALNELLDDSFDNEYPFYIDLGELCPRVKFLM